MKILELKEKEPLNIIEVSRIIGIPTFIKDSNIIYDNMIFTKILTDGVIDKETEEKTEEIKEYYIGKRKYNNKVDIIKTKDVYFKNHNFVITYLICKRFGEIGNIRGWFNYIEKINIYLKDKKDKCALRNAKKVIKDIQRQNYNVDYSSIYNMLLSKREEMKNYEIINSTGNVYELKLK